MSKEWTRRRIENQGFSTPSGLTPELVRWMRFTPWMNFAFTALGTALGSAPLLYFVAILMVVGVLLPAHPWDALYNTVLRPLTGTAKLPPSGGRRKIVFVAGGLWLASTAFCFQSGWNTAGYLLGGMIALLMIPLATMHVCVISEPLDWIFGRRGRGSCTLRES